jgi:hypothetical protein
MFGRRRRQQEGCCLIQHLTFHLGRRPLIVENWLAYSRKSGFSEELCPEGWRNIDIIAQSNRLANQLRRLGLH